MSDEPKCKYCLGTGQKVEMTTVKWGEKLPPYQPCPSCGGSGIPPKPVRVWRRSACRVAGRPQGLFVYPEPALSRRRLSCELRWRPGSDRPPWCRSEILKEGMARCAVKRLTLAPPPWVKGFPYTDHPKSDVAAALVFEQDNPRLTYSMKCSDITAVHKFTGCQ
jgi:hypothetical protein